MKRKFYIQRNSILPGIMLQDYDAESEKYFFIDRTDKPRRKIYKDLVNKTYFDSWEEAFEALKEVARKNVIHAKSRVQSAERDYAEIQKLTKPNYRPIPD